MATYFNPYFYPSFQSKSEIPYFYGEYVDRWLDQVEVFFSWYQTNPEKKIADTTYYLVGEAFEWYQQWHQEICWRRFRLPTWEDFVRDIRIRFKPLETTKSQSELLSTISKAIDEMKQIITEMKVTTATPVISKLLGVDPIIASPQARLLTTPEAEEIGRHVFLPCFNTRVYEIRQFEFEFQFCPIFYKTTFAKCGFIRNRKYRIRFYPSFDVTA